MSLQSAVDTPLVALRAARELEAWRRHRECDGNQIELFRKSLPNLLDPSNAPDHSIKQLAPQAILTYKRAFQIGGQGAPSTIKEFSELLKEFSAGLSNYDSADMESLEKLRDFCFAVYDSAISEQRTIEEYID